MTHILYLVLNYNFFYLTVAYERDSLKVFHVLVVSFSQNRVIHIFSLWKYINEILKLILNSLVVKSC